MIAIPLQQGGKRKYYGSHNLVRSSLPVVQQGLVKSGVLLDDDFRNLVCVPGVSSILLHHSMILIADVIFYG
jgi:hypothetical protein